MLCSTFNFTDAVYRSPAASPTPAPSAHTGECRENRHDSVRGRSIVSSSSSTSSIWKSRVHPVHCVHVKVARRVSPITDFKSTSAVDRTLFTRRTAPYASARPLNAVGRPLMRHSHCARVAIDRYDRAVWMQLKPRSHRSSHLISSELNWKGSAVQFIVVQMGLLWV